MKINNLKISNFLSFGKGIELVLKDYGNLVLVKGSMQQTENSNGAGKSSLFESVYWALAGKTVRGVKAAEVVRFGEKEVKVEITFELKGKIFKVLRIWSKDKKIIEVTVDGELERFHDSKQGTERLFELLGISAELLSLVAFFGSKFTTFSSLTPKNRAEVIDVLAEGKKWEEGRKIAAQNAKDYDTQYKMTLSSIDALKTKISSTMSDIEDYKIKLADRQEENNRLISDQALLLAAAKLQLQECQDNLIESDEDAVNALKAKREEQEKLITAVGTPIEEAYQEIILEVKATINQAELEASELAANVNDRNFDIRQMTTDALKIRRKKGRTNCTDCGQPLPNPPNNQEIENEALEKDKGIQKLKTKNSEVMLRKQEVDDYIKTQLDTITESTKLCQQDIAAETEKLKNEITNINNTIVNINSKSRESKLNLNLAQSKVEKEQATLALLNSDSVIVTLENSIDFSKNELSKLNISRDQEQEKLESRTQLVLVSKYWKQGFKDLRFSAFDNTIKALQELLNSFCSQQGLDFDSIEIQAFKENATGRVLPEINIYVIRNGNKMSLDCLSEGETQRLDLACFFTFSLLIEKSLGFPIGFNILDEPLSGLDYSGRQSVFNTLNDLSKDKQIFIIDHDSNFQDLFNDVINVEKADGVSSIKL